MIENVPANAEDITDVGSTLGQEGPLEEGLATHSSILAWRVSWTEEPGWLYIVHGAQSQTRLKRLSMRALLTSLWPWTSHLITLNLSYFFCKINLGIL